MLLKNLVDPYATEFDKNNQDYYRKIFCPGSHVQVYFGNVLGTDIHSVGDMLAQSKAFGTAMISFHQNGQDKLMPHAVRYYDKYEKMDGRW